ncbi:MAG: SCO family protein [Acidimicrobiaceae bacterium]|nr:SCO family protein [Acidimicrobiaceae bacterium]
MQLSKSIGKGINNLVWHRGTHSRERWQGPRNLHFVIIGVLLVFLAGLDVFVFSRHHSSAQSSQVSVSGIPSNLSISLADLMALAPTSNISAPNFTLTDQNGRTLSLSSFRGHAVVLDFMDPNCTDICPLVSEEFINAYRDVGRNASNVDFVAVNVNKFHLATAEVKSFTDAHGLNQISNWHFFTGSLATLQPVWRQYGIYVSAISPAADVIHSSTIYFIDSLGHERYIGTPTDYHTPQGTAYLPQSQLTAWGSGIAVVARDLIK